MAGTRSADLRDPATGLITNRDFLRSLLQTGKAVEISERPDGVGGSRPVNNLWSLWSTAGEGEARIFSPVATVRTIDADGAEAIRTDPPTIPRGPVYLAVTREVAVAQRLVIFPHLKLPEIPEAA
jgi:hypothetical protein